MDPNLLIRLLFAPNLAAGTQRAAPTPHIFANPHAVVSLAGKQPPLTNKRPPAPMTPEMLQDMFGTTDIARIRRIYGL